MEKKYYKVELKHTDDASKFRPAALEFEKTGRYTAAPKGTKEYRLYWKTQIERSIHGYETEDGDYITGYFYFYLNFCRITVSKRRKYTDRKGTVREKEDRVDSFPWFFDYDRAYFNAIEEAELQGKHMAVLKKRGAGYSYKAAAMLVRNYYCIPKSKSYAIASEMEFLTKDGLVTKAWEMMSFIDEHTGMAKKRQKVDQSNHKRASLIKKSSDGSLIEIGYKSEIMAISLKNDPQKARGKRGKLILWEEAGKFPNLKTAWQIARPSVENDDGTAFGLMICYGCVTGNTKVITNDGRFIPIKDLQKKHGIVGYNTYSIESQEIEAFRRPYDTDCFRLTTNSGRILECSHDHPIVYSHKSLTKRVPNKRKENLYMKTWLWKQAKDFKVGDQMGVIEEVSIFGKNKIWNPRVIGWLIGDGSYGFNKTPVLSNCEGEINKYIDDTLDAIVEKKYLTKEGKLYRETRIKGITKELRALGIYGQTKDAKRLPDAIFSAPKKDVVELLGGLFDTDGYIAEIKRKTGPRIVLTAAHKEILLQVSDLLLKLGVHCKIRYISPNFKNPKDRRGYYRLEIGDVKSLLAFADNITLIPSEKQRRLNIYLKLAEERRSEISKYIHGMRFERVVKVEHIGMQKVYNITAGSTHTYIANGFITHNTGGSEGSDYDGLKEIFYEPKGYNALEVENIWDEGNPDKPCGFFVPQYVNMSTPAGHSVKLTDENGNSNVDAAMEYELQRRQTVIDHTSDRNAVDRYIAERPFNPVEASLEISGNMFPKKALIQHLAEIRNSKTISEFKQVGELVWTSQGKLKWELNPDVKDLVRYRLDPGENKKGAIVIWEHPEEDPQHGLYIGGVDPYDHDKSTTNSLGSCFIYKRFQSYEKYHDMIVAEYTGRPDTADEYYENVRKLASYYNATLLYENEKKGMFDYFRRKHCEYLLADQPGLIKDIVKDSKVERGKGIHMNVNIKMFGEGAVKDYLIEEFAPGQMNLLKIYSEPLLEELINYNDTGNFDRVMAFMMVVLYNKELFNVHVKKKKDDLRSNYVFKTPLFKDKF
jgi:intein/homing endonuclease